ncbi:MAG: hypothetical protein QM734_09005 [Cyclobacteriaceae bacterium]
MKFLKFILIVGLGLGWQSTNAQATYQTASGGGAWNLASTWTYVSGTPVGTKPLSTDNVIINSNVSVPSNTTVNNITVNGTSNVSITANNVTLTVNGTTTMNGTSGFVGGATSRVLSLQGNFIIPSGVGQTPSFLNVTVTQASTANFTVNGTFSSGGGNSGTSGYAETLGNVIVGSTGTWAPVQGVVVNATSLAITDGGTIDYYSGVTPTGGFNLSGGFTVSSGSAGAVSTLGNCVLTVAGATNISGTLYFSKTGAGTKTFNGTITNNTLGEFRNSLGENLVLNCSIVNNSLWAAPLSNNGSYTVNGSGSYTYSGTNTISMSQLNITGAATVTNQGLLALSKSGAVDLIVNNAGASFVNGNGGYLQLLTTGTCITLTSGTINFSTSSNEVDYNYGGAQNVFATTYDKLTASNSGTKTLTGTATVNNILKTSSTAILDDAANTLNGAGSINMTGTSQISFKATGVSLPGLTGTSNTFSSGTTILLYGTAATQTLKASATYPYQNVTVSGTTGCTADLSNVSNIAGNLTISSAAVIVNNAALAVSGTTTYSSTGSSTLANNLTTGSFLISNGTLVYSGLTIIVNGTGGTWTTNGGTLTTNSSSSVVFNTGTGQQIGGTSAPSFVNLTVNNSNDVTLTTNATVTSLLTLTTGRIITGTNNLIVGSSASVSRTSGFVQGNLQKNVNTCASCSITFEVGTSTTYAPLQLTLVTLTVAGSLTASTIASDDPYISSSLINSSNSVNRYWTLTNTGATITGYKPNFTYVSADVDGTATPANFYYSILNASTTVWGSPLAPQGTPTNTSFVASGSAGSTPASGITVHFQVGEATSTSAATVINATSGTPNWSSASTWIQNRTGTSIASANGSPNITGVGTLFTTELIAGDVIMFRSTPGTVLGTVLSITDDTHLILVSNATVTNTTTYGRQHVPNSTDAVQIGNTNVNATTNVQLDVTGSCYSLTFNSQGNAQSLTHVGTNSLTVGSSVQINNTSTNSVTNSWNINGGSATASSLTIGSASSSAGQARVAKVVTTTGTLAIANNITFNTAGSSGAETTSVLDMSGGSGVLSIGGAFSFTNSKGLLTPGTTSTVNFNGTSAQSILPSASSTTYPANAGGTAWTFNNIWANNTSSSGLTLSCNLVSGTNFSGDLRIQSGIFSTGTSNSGGFPGGYNTDITGAATKTFQISPGATFVYSSYSTLSGFGTNYDFGATSTFGTFTYSTNQLNILTGYPYGHLNISNSNYTSLAATTYTIAGNFSISSGSTVQGPASGSAVISVANNLTIASGSTTGFNINSTAISSISVGGNWTNNGSYNNWGSSSVIFTGAGTSQPQTLSGSASETFYNLQLNTAASTNTVQLQKNIAVSNVLTLTQGGLNLNGYSLSITSSSTSAITRTSGYIMSETQTTPYAPVIWTIGNGTGSYVFPFGKNSTSYVPFTFNVTSAGSPYNAMLSAATYGTGSDNTPYPSGVTDMNSGGSDISASVVDRFWIINSTTTTTPYTTSPTATLTFTGTTSEVGTITSLTVQQWSSGNFWNPVFPGQTNSTYSATVPGIFNFGIWTLTGNGLTLPIELTSFRAIATQENVLLNWTTASEINNDHFAIERSVNGEEYSSIGSVKGSGTKSTITNYYYTDNSPIEGLAYYRVVQTDFDGRATPSGAVPVKFLGTVEPKIYPVPLIAKQGYLVLPESWGTTTITFIDSNGNTRSQNNFEGSSAPIKLKFDYDLPGGLYFLSITNGVKRKMIKVIVD